MNDEHKTKEQLISELNELRKQLEESKYYKYLIDQLPVCTIVYSKSGNVIYRNKASEIVDGYDEEELLGLSREEYLSKLQIGPGRATKMLQPQEASNIYSEGIYNFNETTLLSKDGRVKDVFLTGNFIYDNENSLLGVCGCAIDISEYKQEHKKMEIAIKEQVNFLQTLIDTMPNPVFYKDTYGFFQGCNKAYEEYIGLDKSNIVGKSVFDVYPKDLAAKYQKMDKSLFGEPGVQFYESPFLCGDGKRHDIIFSKATYYNTRGEIGGLVGVIVDITERKKMEEALRKSEELFSTIFQFIPNPVAITTIDGELVDINDSFLRVTGFSREEVIGQTTIDLNIWANMEDYTKIRQTIFQQEAISNLDICFRIKSGEVREGLFSTEIIDYRNGKYILGVFNDITEKMLLEKELARLDRLNLVGQMAAGIGHEIRNPMTSVRGFLQILQNKKEFVQFGHFFNLMIDELDRANSIISEFLTLARDRPVDLQREKLNIVLKELTPLISASSINLNRELFMDADDVAEILINKKEIRQLILNMVNNGLEAMEPGGMLTIRSFMDNDEVVLLIQDQGRGIPSDILDKMGTPFFTTKADGTGLGLAICYGIAARHNATISIETGYTGTSFFVRFRT